MKEKRRALDVAAERWRGRATMLQRKETNLLKIVTARAVFCSICKTRVAMRAMARHALDHIGRKS